jgi:RimJ/RimL family protein N-acetyltransferase
MAIDFFELTARLEAAFTPRLALRTASLADAWPLFMATRNSLFNRFLLWPQPEAEDQTLRRLELIVDAAKRGQLSALSAVVRETGEWVSLFRFMPHATRPGTLEMGLWTHARFWEQGYSLELGQLCVTAAFTLTGVDALLAASSLQNKGSCRALREIGLRETCAVMRPVEGGGEVELVEFVITREMWEQLPRRYPFGHYDGGAQVWHHRQPETGAAPGPEPLRAAPALGDG